MRWGSFAARAAGLAAEAITDSQAFFSAVGDPSASYINQRMMDNCHAFIDFDRIDVILASEYRLRGWHELEHPSVRSVIAAIGAAFRMREQCASGRSLPAGRDCRGSEIGRALGEACGVGLRVRQIVNSAPTELRQRR